MVNTTLSMERSVSMTCRGQWRGDTYVMLKMTFMDSEKQQNVYFPFETTGQVPREQQCRPAGQHPHYTRDRKMGRRWTTCGKYMEEIATRGNRRTGSPTFNSKRASWEWACTLNGSGWKRKKKMFITWFELNRQMCDSACVQFYS